MFHCQLRKNNTTEEINSWAQTIKSAYRFLKPSDSCLIGDVWCDPDKPNLPSCARQAWLSFSGYFSWNSDWKYSIGLLSYGSWSAECWEYFANFNWTCFWMVPWQGRRTPVMRFRSVDFPAPFAPRIATRESMLKSIDITTSLSKNYETYSIPKESFSYR